MTSLESKVERNVTRRWIFYVSFDGHQNMNLFEFKQTMQYHASIFLFFYPKLIEHETLVYFRSKLCFRSVKDRM